MFNYLNRQQKMKYSDLWGQKLQLVNWPDENTHKAVLQGVGGGEESLVHGNHLHRPPFWCRGFWYRKMKEVLF